MMKIFQIFGGFCHWDATNTVKSMAGTVGRYAPDIVFVEAPDYVFEGWGYDDTQAGDARFVQPVPPEGFLYDPETGTFYKDKDEPGTPDGTIWDELAAAYREGVGEA